MATVRTIATVGTNVLARGGSYWLPWVCTARPQQPLHRRIKTLCAVM